MNLSVVDKYSIGIIVIIICSSVTLCFCVGYCIARRYNV